MYLSAMVSLRESPAPTHFCVALVGEHVRPPVCPLVLTHVQPKFVHLLWSTGVQVEVFTRTRSP
jgi:hypothetical protein